MNPLFLRPAIHRCPACDYDLAGATSTTCPECGHAITDEDIEFDVRRRTYLEITAPVLWTRCAVLMGVAVVLGRGLPLVLIALAAAGTLVVTRENGGLRPRAVRRAWLLAACWLQLLWFLPLVLERVWAWFYWDLIMPLRLGDFGMSKVVFVSFAGLIIGGALWWWSLRRSRRQLGLEELRPRNQRVRWALLLAVGVQFAVVGITGSLLGLMELLDALWPGWDR